MLRETDDTKVQGIQEEDSSLFSLIQLDRNLALNIFALECQGEFSFVGGNMRALIT